MSRLEPRTRHSAFGRLKLGRVMMKDDLNTSPTPGLSAMQSTIDYSTVPAGLCIRGEMWTGQATTFTELCPKCSRVGLVSASLNDKRIMVHRGRVIGDTLEGIDYCELSISMHQEPHADHHTREYGRLVEAIPNKGRKGFLAAILEKFSQSFTTSLKWITHMWL
jgi:hypothetical protein